MQGFLIKGYCPLRNQLKVIFSCNAQGTFYSPGRNNLAQLEYALAHPFFVALSGTPRPDLRKVTGYLSRSDCARNGPVIVQQILGQKRERLVIPATVVAKEHDIVRRSHTGSGEQSTFLILNRRQVEGGFSV